MKDLFLLASITLLLTSTVFAQKSGIPSSVQKDIDAIKKMQGEIVDGYIKGALPEKYISENARIALPGGMRTTRGILTESLKNRSLKIASSTMTDLRVLVFIDTAIATYDLEEKGSFNGQDITGKTRWTDTWARINGNWLLVASAGTEIDE